MGHGEPHLHPTEEEIRCFMDSHKEHLAFVGRLFASHRKTFGTAVICGALARAFETVDHDEIECFADDLLSSFITHRYVNNLSHHPIRRLREWLDKSAQNHLCGAVFRKECYEKTENALFYYIRRMTMKKLRTADSELFPLREEYM